MRRTPRLLAATVLAAAGLMAAAGAAHAVVDPVHTATCLAGSAADLTTIVDPAAPGVPAEIPAVHCLAP